MDMWKNLTPILKELYKEYNVLDSLSADEKYLEKAFKQTEQLWESQFNLIDRIHFVLLGEAPLYGANRSYFYNENSAYTAFFRHEVYPTVNSTSLRKSDLFIHLRKYGFLIVDLFPFAFNDSTALAYKKISKNKTKELFDSINQIYLEPKLEKIKNKSDDRTVFSLRYKKHRFLSDKIKACLKSLNFLQNIIQIGCVGSSNMPINMGELEDQYKFARNDLYPCNAADHNGYEPLSPPLCSAVSDRNHYKGGIEMNEFPNFMKSPANLIGKGSQYTDEIEGYLFNGADGSQMAFWTCFQDRDSKEHTHDFDEYFVVVQGQYTVDFGQESQHIEVDQECFIPKGTPHSGKAIAGTRTIHCFGDKRV